MTAVSEAEKKNENTAKMKRNINVIGSEKG
jgi:hypothetical protein